MGVSQNRGYPFGGPNSKDYSILGSILGSPYFGKLQYGSKGFGVEGLCLKILVCANWPHAFGGPWRILQLEFVPGAFVESP